MYFVKSTTKQTRTQFLFRHDGKTSQNGIWTRSTRSKSERTSDGLKSSSWNGNGGGGGEKSRRPRGFTHSFDESPYCGVHTHVRVIIIIITTYRTTLVDRYGVCARLWDVIIKRRTLLLWRRRRHTRAGQIGRDPFDCVRWSNPVEESFRCGSSSRRWFMDRFSRRILIMCIDPSAWLRRRRTTAVRQTDGRTDGDGYPV